MKRERTGREIVEWAFPFFFFSDASRCASLQLERIQDSKVSGLRESLQLWFDWQTLMTQLWRMRKAALLIARVQSAQSPVGVAVKQFDEVLPNLKLYRDVFEHMDSYVLEDNNRHNLHVGNGGLQVGTFSQEEFRWAIDDTVVYFDDVALASSTLYRKVKDIVDEIVSTEEQEITKK